MKAPDLARLVFLAALWGGSFIFIRIAAPVLGPIVLVTLRVFLAGSALLVYALITRSDLELRTRWRQYLILGALNSAIPFVLISTAELQLPASLAAILNATSPLFGAVIAAIWIKDPLTRRKIAGLALGLIGVGVLVGWSPTEFTPVVALAAGASLLGAAFYGLASVYTKAKVVGARPIGMATGSQFAAGLLLLPFVPFSTRAGSPSITVVFSVLALALLCTALAYLLYFRLIVDVGPAKALTVTFLVPIFGTLWGRFIPGGADHDQHNGGMRGCAGRHGVGHRGPAGDTAAASYRQSRLNQSLERIQHPNVRTLKIGFVARDQNEISVQNSRGDERIHQRHRFPNTFEVAHKLAPVRHHAGIDHDDAIAKATQ